MVQDKLDRMTEVAKDAGAYLDFDEKADVAEDISTEQAMESGNVQLTRYKCDSGASSHFVQDAVTVHQVQPCDAKIRTANGAVLHVQKKAKLSDSTTETGHTFDMEVQKHEHFTSNLFSIKQATKDGYSAVFR
jgi:hypothetical protein